jgi:ADP-heptose:LPS heptosyltransferase
LSKVLVIRFSSIGDIVLTTPILRCLKKQLKDVEVHFLTKRDFSDILFNNPYINNYFFLQENLSEIIQQLKSTEYDYIIDLHNNLRSWRVKRALKGKSYAFKKRNIEKWLLVNFKKNRMPHEHIVDRFFETVKPIGVINDGEGLDFFINPHDEIDVTKFLPDGFQNGYIAFVIGAKHKTKCMPVNKIISICSKINYPVVLLGGFEDKPTGEEIAAKFKGKVFSSCGKTTVGQSASLVKQSQLVITHDTGLMHIAAAFRKKIISVWGNTVPEFGMYPYLPSGSSPFSIVEVKNLSCRPCSKLGFQKCPKGHFKCMNDIDENEILKIVTGILSAE